MLARGTQIHFATADAELAFTQAFIDTSQVHARLTQLPGEVLLDAGKVVRNAALQTSTAAGNFIHAPRGEPIECHISRVDEQIGAVFCGCPIAPFVGVRQKSADRLNGNNHLANLDRHTGPDRMNARKKLLETCGARAVLMYW